MIITNDTILTDTYREDITIKALATLDLNGITSNDITVEGHATLILHGICSGNIFISPSANVIIHGIVSGTITNHGTLQIFGIVNNLNDISEMSKIESGSIVNGKRY